MVLKGITASLLVIVLCAAVEGAQPRKSDCLSCHDGIDRGKSVHPALAMGCAVCHTAIDASLVPHRTKNKIAKGLSSEVPGLCYGCHEKARFTKKVVHSALAMGCTVCHNPHASNAASLLVEPVVKLCVTCHEKQASGKHVMAGFALGDDHPIKGKTDPSKASRELSCISCHNPHSSSSEKLFVNDTAGPGNLCRLCHRKTAMRTGTL